MPCWYFEKKDIKNSPSYQDGIDTNTESRYRREGARFIIDAGTKLGLRYDTCATGVVYFHRFYMFHSFKEFPRYVTAACCLFLAGKVEETPKKCKDIIKIFQQLLTTQQFSTFREDPKEEVMTLERILLQTVKFDLQIEHPYSLLLKYAKLVKGDKEKVQKLVQMAWTFINDSLCTTLCLQWEPEIIAVSLMYLGTRLNRFDIQDWQGKQPGTKQKWWESIVEDLTVELMEDVCHQVLDLYSMTNQKHEDSPPPPPPSQPSSITPKSQSSQGKRSLSNTPNESRSTPSGQPIKAMKIETVTASRSQSGVNPTAPRSAQKVPDRAKKETPSTRSSEPVGEPVPTVSSSSVESSAQNPYSSYQAQPNQDSYSQYNPYMSSQMYGSSFLSQEGSQSLQTIMSNPTPAAPQYGSYSQPPAHPPPPGQAPPYGQPAAPHYGQPGAPYQPQSYPPGTQPPYSAPPPSFQGQAYPEYSQGQGYSQQQPDYQQQYMGQGQGFSSDPYGQPQGQNTTRNKSGNKKHKPQKQHSGGSGPGATLVKLC